MIILESKNDEIRQEVERKLLKNQKALTEYWIGDLADILKDMIEFAKKNDIPQHKLAFRYRDARKNTGISLNTASMLASLYDDDTKKPVKDFKKWLKDFVEKTIVNPIIEEYSYKYLAKVSPFLSVSELKDVKAGGWYPYRGGIDGTTHFVFENGLEFDIHSTVRVQFAPKSGYFFFQYPFRFTNIVFPDGSKKKSMSQKDLLNKVVETSTGVKQIPSYLKKISYENGKFQFKIPANVIRELRSRKYNPEWFKYIVSEKGRYWTVAIDDLRKIKKSAEESVDVLYAMRNEPKIKRGFGQVKANDIYNAELALSQVAQAIKELY